jgi:hypothetical protein
MTFYIEAISEAEHSQQIASLRVTLLAGVGFGSLSGDGGDVLDRAARGERHDPRPCFSAGRRFAPAHLSRGFVALADDRRCLRGRELVLRVGGAQPSLVGEDLD